MSKQQRVFSQLVGDAQLKIVGDPHLGRQFINNVPLAKRGVRDMMVREDFLRALDPEGAEVHVCMGDLFDKKTVPLETIFFAANAYIEAANTNGKVLFYILAGNHDLSRNVLDVSAFEIFKAMVLHQRNIMVVTGSMDACGLWFFPWSPWKTAAEMVAGEEGTEGIDVAFGHWDLDGASTNLIPIEQLKKLGIRKVYNGHVHLPRIEQREGIEVVNVGSLQPYAHGEGDELYKTVSLEEARTGNFKDVCVRVRLEPGEALDFDIDALAVQVQRSDVAELDLSVDYDTAFDLTALAEQARSEANVPEEIWAQVKERCSI